MMGKEENAVFMKATPYALSLQRIKELEKKVEELTKEKHTLEEQVYDLEEKVTIRTIYWKEYKDFYYELEPKLIKCEKALRDIHYLMTTEETIASVADKVTELSRKALEE